MLYEVITETDDPLLRIIRETVLHELAHYFGFSEEEMDAVEQVWAASDGRPLPNEGNG